MTTRTRPAGVPAYYLARPAALWLTAFRPRSTTGQSPRSSCAGDAPGSSPDTA